MRLWHKDLISVLPNNQLSGQWRECCLIAKALKEGMINHLLVNRVKDYDVSHFIKYSTMVFGECYTRGMTRDVNKFNQYFTIEEYERAQKLTKEDLFLDWHNDRYFKQCFYNLQEKFDCGGINTSEWIQILLIIPHNLIGEIYALS